MYIAKGVSHWKGGSISTNSIFFPKTLTNIKIKWLLLLW